MTAVFHTAPAVFIYAAFLPLYSLLLPPDRLHIGEVDLFAHRNLLSLAAAGDVDLILHKAQWWWKDGEEKRKLHEEARKVALQSARAGLKKGMKS